MFLFPFLWVAMFLYRVVWFDFLHTLIEIFLYLFVNPLSSLWLLVTLPFVLVFDIPIALFVTFTYAIVSCKEISYADTHTT